MPVLVLPLVLPWPFPFRLCFSVLCSCMEAPSSVWHEYGQPRNLASPFTLQEEVGSKDLLL